MTKPERIKQQIRNGEYLSAKKLHIAVQLALWEATATGVAQSVYLDRLAPALRVIRSDRPAPFGCTLVRTIGETGERTA